MASIVGSLIGKAIGAFGDKPNVPQLPEISPEAVQRATATSNLATLPEAEKLASAVNAARRRAGVEALESAAPGAQDILASGTKSIASMLRGELPEDVRRQLQQASAEAGVAGGFAGTQLGAAKTARDIGLTSLQLTQQGINSAQSWLQGAVQLTQPGGVFDVSNMFFSPSERLAFEERDRSARFQRDLMEAQVQAAPDPGTAAIGAGINDFVGGVRDAAFGAAGTLLGGSDVLQGKVDDILKRFIG